MKELFRNFKKIATSFLAICLILSMLPLQVFAADTTTDENITVQVSVENNIFLEDAGNGAPAFTGELVSTTVEVPKGTSGLDAFKKALDKEKIEYKESGGYVSSIGGLSEFDGGSASGWMVTINDWFTNTGIGDQVVEDNDEIRFMYTCNYGEDLGGSWNNNDKTLKALKTDVGTLSPEFSSDVKEYELKVPEGTKQVVVTPTATNKNFQVRASVGDTEYKRIQAIPVQDGTVITVKCGDPDWPSMNGGSYGDADKIPAETYKITVAEEKSSSEDIEGNYGETIDTVPDDFANDLWLQYDFKELKSGDTATIYPRRVPQIIDNPISNNITRPDFNFEIIKGDSITLDTTKTTDKATVTAVKEGTSIVKVTYDVVGDNGASSIVNTAYVVYDVIGDTDTGITIDSNITLTSYDTIYYTEGKSVDYTINPTVEGADEVKVTCNGKTIEKTDDGYVLPLENRSNIIGIIAKNDKGTKKYYKVIDARKIEISVVNASREGEELQAGDTAKISFKGITHPVYKLATIYNPTWLQESWGNKGTFVEYTNDIVGTVKGYCKQYDLATNNTITVTFDKEGSYKFTSGRIFTQWWGSELGADKGEEGKGDPNLSAPQNERYFSSMPDFTIDVKEKDPTVTFDADNGTDKIVKSVKKGEILDYTPEVPTKDGYTFVGWYFDTDDTTTKYQLGATYTEDVTYKAKWAHVEMLGAQGKLVVDGKSGIRFGTKIYDDGDEIVEKGTLIIPANLLEEGQALTLDNKKAARSIGKVNYEVNKEENYVTYLGTIINIPETQFDREMTAASYVIYKDKVGNEYKVYSQYPNKSTSVYKLLGNSVDWDNEW
ncbi:DUF4430 domain-containing protein [Intestinibacter sp.]|uniref:DUF4430 domain-containing protein n=1 Tax=Intestinibacter sp. TaxID=1965304 RepID=UPI003F1852EA